MVSVSAKDGIYQKWEEIKLGPRQCVRAELGARLGNSDGLGIQCHIGALCPVEEGSRFEGSIQCGAGWHLF